MFWSNQISLLAGQACIKLGDIYLYNDSDEEKKKKLNCLSKKLEVKSKEFSDKDIRHMKLSFAFFILGVALVLDGFLYLLFGNSCSYCYLWVIGLLPAIAGWFIIGKYVQKILETKIY